MNKSESVIELAKALSKFQGEVKQPKKDNDNPFFKSKYVNLEGVVDAISKTASKYGLSYMQFPVNRDNEVGVYTLVMHESGEFIESEPIFTKLAKQDAQAVGSALTYLRRYSLSAVFGITSENDDDGEGAMNRNASQNNYQAPQNNYQAPQQQQSSKPSYSSTTKPNNAEEASALVVGFGKHKGKTLKQLWKEDIQYLMWLLENEKTDPNIKEGIELMQLAVAQVNASKASN